MKYHLFILFILWQNIAFAKQNAIDSIKTDADVIRFLNTHLQEDKVNFKDFNFERKYLPKAYDSICKVFIKSSWSKTDFDKNGQTDLMAFDFESACAHIVFSLPIGKYKRLTIGGFCNNIVAQLILYNDTPMIRYFHTDYGIPQRNPAGAVDTLVYKFNKFVNYNPKYNQKIILDSLNYTLSGGLSFGSVTMKVKFNGISTYEVESDYSKQKHFLHRMNKESIDQLTDIAGYINFVKLASRYKAGCTDKPGAVTVFYFRGVEPIEIYDNGLNANFTMHCLYETLDKMTGK